MGLDQYLKADGEEIGYWRKHPDLHGFIESAWREAGGEGDFNCVDFELSEELIEKILKCSENRDFGENNKTTGFFFGSTDNEKHDETIKIMEYALELKRQGKKILYSSWW